MQADFESWQSIVPEILSCKPVKFPIQILPFPQSCLVVISGMCPMPTPDLKRGDSNPDLPLHDCCKDY